MTITATTEPLTSPPRVAVEIEIATGSVMSAAAIYRNDTSGRTLLRTQPNPGFDSQTVYDYEAPYGQVVTYDWEGAYYDPTANATVFSEPWSSFPGSWTGDTGSGSIASNRLTLAASLKSITRTVATDWDRIVVQYLSATFSAPIGGGLQFKGVSSQSLTLSSNGGFLEYRATGGISYTVTTIDATQPITITRTSDGYSFEGTGGASVAVGTTFDLTGIEIETASVSTVVGAITISTIAASTDVAEESASVTLDSDLTWLIHPGTPGLSVSLGYNSSTRASIAGVGEVANPTQRTLHQILGSSSPVAVSTGSRLADQTVLRVLTLTSDERVALRALLAPDTPLLVQVPPAWGVDFASGFYSVGDTEESRPAVVGTDPARETLLPLTAVQSPVTDVSGSTWTYSHLTTEFDHYSDLSTVFATYADMASNTR